MDTCSVCNTDYHYGTSRTACYADISNCETYDTTDPSACATCKSSYTLVNGACT